MRIVTYSCPHCGTIVAANELEERRVMPCPGLSCDSVIRFEDLPQESQEYFIEHRDRYQL
jgi:DNA-directed RNA polymerase subunit RPC12/RpoP